MGGRKNRSHSLPVPVDCCQALTYRKREITVSGEFTSLIRREKLRDHALPDCNVKESGNAPL